MLKIFHRFDVLQKYFNMKILQHSICNSVIGFHAAHACKERQARASGRNIQKNCHRRVFSKRMVVLRLPCIQRSMGSGGWRVVGVRKKARKCYRLIHCGCEKELSYNICHKKVSRVCLLFLRLGGTIECTVINEVPCPLLFKAMLMEPVGSESLLLGQK